MSAENVELASVDSYYQVTIDAVRGLAEAVLRQRDGDELLRLLGAVGTIATGLREFSTSDVEPLTFQPGEELEVPAPIELHRVAAVTESDELMAVAPEETLQAAEPVVSGENIGKEEVVTPSDPEHSTLELIKEQYPELRLSDREAGILLAMIKTGGNRFKANDITEQITGGSKGALSQAMSIFVRKFKESPYAEQLTYEGERGARRYWWRGTAELPFAEDEPVILDHAESESDQPIEEEVAEEVKDARAELAKFGLEFSQNGSKYISIKGAPLKLSRVSVDVLTAIALNQGDIRFKELINNKDLLEHASGTNFARDLNESLQEIGHTLKENGIAWEDKKIPENGKMIRIIRMGEIAHEPHSKSESDFLALGR